MRYHIRWSETYDDPFHDEEKLEFQFDIPISDAGGGHFTPMMKGIEVLRWARKQLEMLQAAQEESQR
jgi:hypothetical protein